MRIRWLVPVVASVVLATPLLAGPPWLTVELPPNPFDRANRGAFLLVHAFHHAGDATEPLTGRAIGNVDGQRRTLPLAFERTERPGVYALKNSWGDKGVWVLVLTNDQGGHDGWAAEVLVRIADGRVTGIDTATRPSRWAQLPLEPRRFTDAEIEASLKGR